MTARAATLATGALVGLVVLLASPAAALDTEGADVVSWGDNTWGQMGNDDSAGDPVLTPAVVRPGDLPFVSIVTGYAGTTLGLLSDGTAYAWGSNGAAQFGNGTLGTTSPSPIPVSMPAGISFTQVSIGDIVALALDADGTVWGWGQNLFGVLGSTVSDYVTAPLRIPFPAGVVIERVISSSQAAYAFDSEGRVWAWGNNFNGQLAQPDSVDSLLEPTLVPLPDDIAISDLSAGSNSVLAITADGALYGWGQNQMGQLAITIGQGLDGSNLPNDVFEVTAITAVTGRVIAAETSGLQSLALLDDGSLQAWGSNEFGELGIGATSPAYQAVPVEPDLPADVTTSTVAAGIGVSFAVTTDGRVFAWGSNADGGLGDGTTIDRATPGVVALPAGTVVRGVTVAVDTAFAAVTIPPELVTTALPGATVGEAYSASISATGTAPWPSRSQRARFPLDSRWIPPPESYPAR